MFLMNFSILLLFPLTYKIVVASYTNFQVKSYNLCNNTQGAFKIHANITKENDNMHYITGKFFFPIPWDENVGLNLKIELLVFNSYVELFTIREKNLCKAANMYAGEMWYTLQRGAQVMERKCPLLAGRYELHHVEMDFNKISLQTFPFGYLRFTAKAVDNRNPDHKLFCIEIEVENIPN